MNEARAARIEAKYSGSKAQTQKKQMDMGKGAGPVNQRISRTPSCV